MAEIDKMHVGIYADPKGMKKGLDQAKGQMQTFGSQIKKIGGMLLGAAGLTGGFIAVTNQIKKAVSEASEFEKTMANVKTLLSASEREKFGDFLDEGSLRIMREYGFEIKDTNKALFDAISAGISAGDSIKFLEEAARLATAGVTSLSISVDGMTSIMNAYSMSIEEANLVASAFFTAQKYGKTTVGELAQNVGLVAPIAKQAGVGFDELLTSMAELTKMGIRTDLAATAIRATLSTLLAPQQAAREKFDELGIAVGATAIKERGFFNVLADITEASQENSDVLVELIPNVRALAGVGALGTKELEEMDEILRQLNTDIGEGSSYMAAYNLQMQTFAKRMETAKARVSEFRMEKGGPLGKVWLGVLESFFPKEGGTMDKLWDSLSSLRRWKKEYEAELDDLADRLGAFTPPTEFKENLGFTELQEIADASMAAYKKATEAVEDEIETITTLKTKLEKLEKQKENTNIADTKAFIIIYNKIAAINAEIKAIEDLANAEMKAEKARMNKFAPMTEKGGEFGGVSSKIAGRDARLDVSGIAPSIDELVENTQEAAAQINWFMKDYYDTMNQMTLNFAGSMIESVGYFTTASDQINNILQDLTFSLGDFLSQLGNFLIMSGRIGTGLGLKFLGGAIGGIGSRLDSKGVSAVASTGRNSQQLVASVSGTQLNVMLKRADATTDAIT